MCGAGWMGVGSGEQPLHTTKSVGLGSLQRMVALWPGSSLPSRAPPTQHVERGQSPTDGFVARTQ